MDHLYKCDHIDYYHANDDANATAIKTSQQQEKKKENNSLKLKNPFNIIKNYYW